MFLKSVLNKKKAKHLGKSPVQLCFVVYTLSVILLFCLLKK
jgi:hypothetical protein